MAQPGTGRYWGGIARARVARSSHWALSLQEAVSTTRRCMAPSRSMRVPTTLISPFCPRLAQSWSCVPGGRFDIVVDAGRGQQPIRAALVYPESRLGWQIMAAPADTVEFQRATNPVVEIGR